MLIRAPKTQTGWLLWLGALSFVPTLFFYLVGEEGIYTITSMEMWYQQNWIQQLMYGADNHRPPLMNWLVMPVAQLIGWSHVVVASRLVSVAATLGCVAWLYWLSEKLFADRSFALFAALSALSMADLLLYRGWLSYTDPTFAFFTFGAIATLWVATINSSWRWLLTSVLLISCAMLTKAFTAYIFYGSALLVIALRRPARTFLLCGPSAGVMALALLVPMVWFRLLPQVGGHSSTMVDEIARKLSAQSGLDYLLRLLTYPLETAFWLSPVVLLAAYLLWRRRVSIPETYPERYREGVLIAVLCIAPYWLSPQGGIRYLLPVYPLIALAAARIVWRTGARGQALALRWYAALIAVKFLFALLLFPYYQTHYRGENYARVGQEILQKTHGFPLYTNNSRSAGLSVVSYIDAQRFPRAPLVMPPQEWDSGFVISPVNDASTGELAFRYQLAADELFVLCRGAACQAGRQ
ncbi:hypothetical protein [Ferriphaselus sp. R-1]|uniref:ArnT family glycosyltransferase n=1 Tax=Ferriphaselus sp. R-1 TaxID=1485544 RepID=UPI000554FB2F|nr:hypothetical protein [Ferriphaselus sp. R-1]